MNIDISKKELNKIRKTSHKEGVDALRFIHEHFDDIFEPLPGSFTKENIKGALDLASSPARKK